MAVIIYIMILITFKFIIICKNNNIYNTFPFRIFVKIDSREDDNHGVHIHSETKA